MLPVYPSFIQIMVSTDKVYKARLGKEQFKLMRGLFMASVSAYWF